MNKMVFMPRKKIRVNSEWQIVNREIRNVIHG